MDPKRTNKILPNPSIENKNKLKLPFVQPAFIVDKAGKQEIAIMQHSVQEGPTKFQLLCAAASAARKVLKEQEAKEMQKKKDSGVSSPESCSK